MLQEPSQKYHLQKYQIPQGRQVQNLDGELLMPLSGEILAVGGFRPDAPLEVAHYPGLDSITKEEWQTLFPAELEGLEGFDFTCFGQQCGFQGYRLYSVVVRQAGIPLLYIPVHVTQYALLNHYDGPGQALLRKLEGMFPAVFKPNMLGIGFVEGAWGEVGYRADAPAGVLKEAWLLAHRALQALAVQTQSAITVWVDFRQQDSERIPAEILSRYARTEGCSYGLLPVEFKDMEDYLARLSAGTRKDLRRKLKKRQELRIVRRRHASELSEETIQAIFRLYRSTVDRGNETFGTQNMTFFQGICAALSEAEYVLYYHQDELIAFNLLFRSDNLLVDKYLGMQAAQGKALNIFFLSWLENIQYCIENGIRHYFVGPTSDQEKRRLGALMVPTTSYFRHRNPLLHWLCARLSTLE